MTKPRLSPIDRILTVAVISGFISGILVLMLMMFVFASAWFFFIIPVIMGWSISKFSRITKQEMDEDEKLEKKAGWISAGVVLLFVVVTAVLISVAVMSGGNWTDLFLNIPFLIVSSLSVWYGYSRGVRAVVDAYYDADAVEE